MNGSDYAYSVAYVRAIENRLLTKADMENLITAKTPEEAVRILLDKGYGAEQVAPEQFERLLSAQLTQTWQEIADIAPKGAPLDILLYRNDFHNLKAAMKGVRRGISDIENYLLAPSTVDVQDMISAVANMDFTGLPPMLAVPAAAAYDVLARTGDSQLADTIIDRASMDVTLQMAEETKNAFFIEYIKLSNTLADIKTIMRCARTEKDAEFMETALSARSGLDKERLIKAALAGAGDVIETLEKTGFPDAAEALKESMTAFEKYADNQITNMMRSARYVTLGVEPLIAYLHAKQLELQSVRIIMSAKLGGFDEESIRARLRDFA